MNRGVAVLIDPDKFEKEEDLEEFMTQLARKVPDMIFIGGSTVSKESFQHCVAVAKDKFSVPIVLFPGSADQLSHRGDALLYLSLISGRNPDYLIGHHVSSIDELEKMDIEIIPTSYLLIDGGKKSAAEYVSNTTPIPCEGYGIAHRTSMAGKYLGHQLLYADAGSGALTPVSEKMIRVLAETQLPLIIGGGIKTMEDIERAHDAGANLVVIGNKIEEDAGFLSKIKDNSATSIKMMPSS